MRDGPDGGEGTEVAEGVEAPGGIQEANGGRRVKCAADVLLVLADQLVAGHAVAGAAAAAPGPSPQRG